MTRQSMLPALFLAVLTPTLASAQVVASFADLPQRLNVGDAVTVDDTGGTRVRGRLLRMTPDSIALAVSDDQVTLARDRVARVAACCDSLINGPLIGLAAGGVFGVMFMESFSDSPTSTSDQMGAFAIFGGIGAGLGLGFDALIRADKVVYRARTVTTLVRLGPGRSQVSVAWSW